MTAPGKYLEVFESQHFRARVAPLPDLARRVRQHLAAWPDAGRPVAPGVREVALHEGPSAYSIFVRRAGQRLGVLNIFELPLESDKRGRYLEEVRRTFGRHP